MDDYQVIVKHHESHYSGEAHTHDYAHLAFIHQGCQILSTDQHSLLSMPGSLIYIPVGVPHRADFLKQSHVSLLRLPQASIRHSAANSRFKLSVIPRSFINLITTNFKPIKE